MIGLRRVVAMSVANRGCVVIAQVAMAIEDGERGRCRGERLCRGASVRRHPQLAEEQHNEERDSGQRTSGLAGHGSGQIARWKLCEMHCTAVNSTAARLDSLAAGAVDPSARHPG